MLARSDRRGAGFFYRVFLQLLRYGMRGNRSHNCVSMVEFSTNLARHKTRVARNMKTVRTTTINIHCSSSILTDLLSLLADCPTTLSPILHLKLCKSIHRHKGRWSSFKTSGRCIVFLADFVAQKTTTTTTTSSTTKVGIIEPRKSVSLKLCKATMRLVKWEDNCVTSLYH